MSRYWPIHAGVWVAGILFLSSILTACGSGDSASPATNATTTVAGVDANGDGVRDDIETYIDTTYPVAAQSETNHALRQYAKAAQSSLIHADNPSLSVTHATERFRALECLMAKRPRDFHPLFVELRARLLDTTARSNAYFQADSQVKTANIPLLPMNQWGTACL